LRETIQFSDEGSENFLQIRRQVRNPPQIQAVECAKANPRSQDLSGTRDAVLLQQQLFHQAGTEHGFNSQRTVLENFFNGMIYAAYKFDAAVMALRSSTEDFNFVAQTLDNIVRKYASKVYEKIQKYKGVYHSQDLTFQVLRILGYKAFTLVFKRRNEIYKELVDQIRQVSKLKLNFFGSQFDSTYFNKLPQVFKDVKINRKASI
jgi:hypothetical protein